MNPRTFGQGYVFETEKSFLRGLCVSVVNAGNFMLCLIKPSTYFETDVEILYQLVRRLSNDPRFPLFLTNEAPRPQGRGLRQTPSNYLALNLLRY